MIAFLQRGDAGADVDDDARALVTEDHREEPLRVGARARELVGVADAGRADLHQDLAGLRSIEIDGFDDERLAGFVGDGGTGLHRWLPVVRAVMCGGFCKVTAMAG